MLWPPSRAPQAAVSTSVRVSRPYDAWPLPPAASSSEPSSLRAVSVLIFTAAASRPRPSTLCLAFCSGGYAALLSARLAPQCLAHREHAPTAHHSQQRSSWVAQLLWQLQPQAALVVLPGSRAAIVFHLRIVCHPVLGHLSKRARTGSRDAEQTTAESRAWPLQEKLQTTGWNCPFVSRLLFPLQNNHRVHWHQFVFHSTACCCKQIRASASIRLDS